MEKIRLLSDKDQKQLLEAASTKYKAIILLMLDCGLRVTEALRLTIGDIDTVACEIHVRSLKKRKKQKVRVIPLTDRCRDALIDYILTLRSKDKESFLFPSKSKTGHVSRVRVWRYIKQATGYRFSPHDLRHTFASKVANSSGVRVAQGLLGHASESTTEIYLHLDAEEKREAIKSIVKENPIRRFYRKWKRKADDDLVLIRYEKNDEHVGRSKEIKELRESYEIKENVILTGAQGVGKSHLLGFIHGDKILRLDDFKQVKKTISDIYSFIVDSDDRISDLLLEATGRETHQSVLTRTTSARLIDRLVQCTKKKEWTIIIDDLTDITKSGVRALEKMKNHFHIIAAAREIKIAYSTMLTNFRKMEIEALDRVRSFALIAKRSAPIASRIDDYFVFRDHVFRQSGGNPLFIEEVIERLAHKRIIDSESIRDTRHTSAVRDIDVSLFVVLLASSLMILRYVGSETGDSAGAFRLFGGVFLLFALFARQLLGSVKRKFV